MFEAHAYVPTDKASRYLMQLCKHFAHVVDAEWSKEKGLADFGRGRCDLEADPGLLRLACCAPTPEDLVKVQQIVEDHLLRLAWREDLSVDWFPGPSEVVRGSAAG